MLHSSGEGMVCCISIEKNVYGFLNQLHRPTLDDFVCPEGDITQHSLVLFILEFIDCHYVVFDARSRKSDIHAESEFSFFIFLVRFGKWQRFNTCYHHILCQHVAHFQHKGLGVVSEYLN